MRDDVAARQVHVRALVEHPQDVGLGVLARQAHQHAPAFGRDREVLHRQEAGVQRDAGDAVLADDAAPDRVVAVEHEHLVRRDLAQVHLARDDDRQRAEPVVGVRDVGEPVGHRVVARGRAQRVDRPVAEHDSVGQRLERGDEPRGLRVDGGRQCRFDGGRGAQHEHEQGLGRALPELAEGVHQFAGDADDGAGPVGAGLGVAHEVLQPQQHHADALCGRVARQHAGRGQQLLEQLVIRRERDVGVEAGLAQHERERRLEALGGERGGDRDADRRRDGAGCRRGRGGVDGGRHGRASGAVDALLAWRASGS